MRASRKIETAVNVLDTAIRSRKSIRAFRSDPVPKRLLMEIVDAARAAPSNFNSQPWRVYLLTGKAKDALSDAITRAYQGEHKKIGTVERCGLNAHANFVGAGRREFDGADPGPILVGNNDGSYCVSHDQAILLVIVVPVGAAASSGKHQSQASRWPTLCAGR